MAKKSTAAPVVDEPAAKVTKTEAVRRAVAAGVTKPQEGVEWVVAQFGEGVRMPAGQFSSYKSQLKVKADGGTNGGGSNGSGGIDAARQVHKLVKAYDLETVQAVAAVLYQHDAKAFKDAVAFVQELQAE